MSDSVERMRAYLRTTGIAGLPRHVPEGKREVLNLPPPKPLNAAHAKRGGHYCERCFLPQWRQQSLCHPCCLLFARRSDAATSRAMRSIDRDVFILRKRIPEDAPDPEVAASRARDEHADPREQRRAMAWSFPVEVADHRLIMFSRPSVRGIVVTGASAQLAVERVLASRRRAARRDLTATEWDAISRHRRDKHEEVRGGEG